MPILANEFLRRADGDRFGAYMMLQRCLMQHFFCRGGTTEDWVERIAPRFRERYAQLHPSSD